MGRAVAARTSMKHPRSSSTTHRLLTPFHGNCRRDEPATSESRTPHCRENHRKKGLKDGSLLGGWDADRLRAPTTCRTGLRAVDLGVGPDAIRLEHQPASGRRREVAEQSTALGWSPPGSTLLATSTVAAPPVAGTTRRVPRGISAKSSGETGTQAGPLLQMVNETHGPNARAVSV